jgi:hypothetical protein
MQDYTQPVPSGASSSPQMRIAGVDSAQPPHGVMADYVYAGAVEEPLVLDFAAMHNGFDTKDQSPPLTPPPSHKASGENYDHWLSDDERHTPTATAPAPPDFTRRGIHIPSRTRLVSRNATDTLRD